MSMCWYSFSVVVVVVLVVVVVVVVVVVWGLVIFHFAPDTLSPRSYMFLLLEACCSL